MFFFKLVFLKKKKKLDNKGAALANVLLITTFVMVITSSVLSMAYNTYRMKLINVSSKDNLYACEAVLEQVRVGFRNQFTEITDSYTELTADNVVKAFEAFYKDYQLDGYIVGDDYRVGESMSGTGIYYYDIVKVAKLLTSISGTGNATVIVDETNATTNLDYDDGRPVFTSSVDITVNDSDYENIKVTLQANATGKNNFELTETYVTFHDLTVIYSENGYESEVTTDITIEFPEVGTVTVSSGSSSGNAVGWVELTDRLKSYTQWAELFNAGTYTDFGISSVPVTGDAVYINTTDYPANTVTSVIFEMERYSISTNSKTGDYVHAPVSPWVQVQDGEGTGTQYAACGSGDFDNVYIYIGIDGDEENPDNWIKYTDVFNTTDGFFNNSGSSVDDYQSYYSDYLTSTDGSPDEEKHVTVKYKVDLLDDYGNYNSRGWVLITGSVYGNSSEIVVPVINSNAKMYVNITGEREKPTFYFEFPYDGDDQKGASDQNWLYVDFSDTNYFVGDTLHISLKNVDAQAIYDNISNWAININQQDVSIYGGGDSTLGMIYPTSGTGANPYYGDCDIKVNKDSSTTLDIYIEVTWSIYPYLSIHYYYGLSGGVTVDMEWTSSDGTTVTGTTTGTTSDAVIYYEDWRKE